LGYSNANGLGEGDDTYIGSHGLNSADIFLGIVSVVAFVKLVDRVSDEIVEEILEDVVE
jgi:hypothetical protein